MRLGRLRHHPQSAQNETVSAGDVSVVGPELRIAGELRSDGEIHVFGSISGNLEATRVAIMPGGAIEGDVIARDVSVGGRLNGRIVAPVVAIEETGSVVGRVFHNEITVAKGGFVDGRMPWRPINHFDKSASIVEETTSEHVHEKRSGR